MNEEQIKIPICKRCHRKLKDIDSINKGLGPVCYKKSIENTMKKPLFSVKYIKEEFDDNAGKT